MRIAELMKREVMCCSPADSLNEASRIMWDHDCGSLPVVDSKRRLVGVLTDRDICMAAYTRGRRLGEMTVAETMSRTAHGCEETDDIQSAHRLMRKLQVRRLPVLDQDRRVIGFLGLSDLAGVIVEGRTGVPRPEAEEFATTYSAVTRPRKPAPAPGRTGSLGKVKSASRPNALATNPRRNKNKSTA